MTIRHDPCIYELRLLDAGRLSGAYDGVTAFLVNLFQTFDTRKDDLARRDRHVFIGALREMFIQIMKITLGTSNYPVVYTRRKKYNNTLKKTK